VPRIRIVCMLLAVVASTARADLAAQTVETGFLNRTLVIDGEEYRYQVYVPREFQPTKKWPVIVALHGGGEYGNDCLRQTAFGVADAIRRNADRFPALAMFPQADQFRC
jgi:predicted peptidase